MKLFITLALFDSCPADWLNDPARHEATLEDAIVAGKFSKLRITVVPFSPQGVTACAIVGESHLALHSWPEEGRLFVDIASCSSRESTQLALAAIQRALPSCRLASFAEHVIDPDDVAGKAVFVSAALGKK